MYNLAFDAKRAYQNYYGIGNYSRHVLQSMINLFPDNKYYLYAPQVKIHFIDHIVEYKNRVTLIDINSLPKFVHPIWHNAIVPFDLKRKNIQLYHGLSNELSKRIPKSIPKVVTIHSLNFFKHPELYSYSERSALNKQFQYACKNATTIITLSNYTKQEIMECYSIPEKNIEVIYQDCGIRFRKSDSQNTHEQILHKYNISDPYILSVGTIEKRKNHLTIIKSFKQLKNKNLRLLLVGRSTSYIKELQNYIIKNDLTHRVRIITDVTGTDLASLYKSAIFSVYAAEAEGFGIPVLESLYMDCPVITVRNTPMSEIASDAALYFSARNEEELAEQMNLLISDSNIRNALIAKGKERMTLFEPNQSIGKTMNIYKTIIEG